MFADHQIFFTCQDQLFCKDTDLETLNPIFISTERKAVPRVPDFSEFPIGTYQFHIENYMKTSITYPSDRLLAFAAIEHIFCNEIESEMFIGIPLKYTAEFLAFESEFYKDSDRNFDFPSWSWAAWGLHDTTPGRPGSDSATDCIQFYDLDEPIELRPRFVSRSHDAIAHEGTSGSHRRTSLSPTRISLSGNIEDSRREDTSEKWAIQSRIIGKLSDAELSHLVVIDTELALIEVESEGTLEEIQETPRHYQFGFFRSTPLDEPLDFPSCHSVRLDPSWRRRQASQLEFILLDRRKYPSKSNICMVIATDERGYLPEFK